MAKAFAIWGLASLLGVALVVLLPDGWLGGAVLIRFSDRHGPSAADAIGVAVGLAGWGYFVRAVWRRWPVLTPRALAWALLACAMASVLGCIAAATADQDAWLIALTALALTAQVLLGLMARRA